MRKLLLAIVWITLMATTACKDDDPTTTTTTKPPPPTKTSSAIIAVGQGATILRSVDAGKTWTKATIPSGITDDLNNAKYLNGKWWAVGGFSSGIVQRSLLLVSDDDGATWQKVETPAVSRLNDITYNNGLYIAVGTTKNISLSMDGTTWTKVDLSTVLKSPSPGDEIARFFLLSKVLYENNSIVVVGIRTTVARGIEQFAGLVLESKDKGVTWKTNLFGSSRLNSLLYADGRFLALGGGKVVVTSEGDGWMEDRRSGKPPILSPILYNGMEFVAFSKTVAVSKVTFGNFDNWAERGDHSFTNLSVTALMYDGDGTYVFAGAGGSNIDIEGVALYTSTDNGTTWASQRSKVAPEGSLLLKRLSSFRTGVFAQSHFIIAGHQERSPGTPTQIFTSDDGLTWAESQLPELTLEERIIKITTGSN